MASFTVCGAAVSNIDLARLMRMLLGDAGPDAVEAADRLVEGIRAGSFALDLEAAQRDAVLGVLEDPPDGLVELQGILTSDHARRVA